MDKQQEIKQFWESQADQHGANLAATMPDYHAKMLEIENISENLRAGARVADFGCGNGFSTLHYVKQIDLEIHGFDYSASMIAEANKVRETLAEDVQSRVAFSVADVTDSGLDSALFDIVITDRCLINLTSRDEQVKAIKEMHRLLRAGGRYLMCEHTEQGLSNLNKLRIHVGLDPIEVRWHNLYMDEAHLQESFTDIFTVEKIVKFSSFYYLASRVINAKIAQQKGEEPSYDNEINRIAAMCSSLGDFGDFGPLKLYVLKKL